MPKKKERPFRTQIYEIRKDQNLTQVQMAKKLDIPLRTYQNWEEGSRVPPRYTQEVVKILASE